MRLRSASEFAKESKRPKTNGKNPGQESIKVFLKIKNEKLVRSKS
jgi:hypothetical protein